MTGITDKIKTQGYWRVVIRPADHQTKRVPQISDLFTIVQQASVQIRGWDFPHIDHNSREQRGETWVGQDFEWEHHLERWRIYQSGQFIYLGAFTVDWHKSTANWSPPPPKPHELTF